MSFPDTLKPTPLAPLYGEGVVEWMDVFGFAIPVTWGDPAAECDAIRNHVAVIEFSMLLKVDVTGPGAAECVNRVFSRDVTALKPGRVAYGVVVDPDGHMVDDCTVFYHGPDRVMVMGANPRLADDLALAAGPGVQVRDCGADYAHISVQGPKSRALLQELTGDDLSNTALRYYDFRDGVAIAGIPMQISRLGFTGELGYELLLPVSKTPDLWRALTKAGQNHGLRSVGGAGLMMARIEAGLIMGGLEYDETSTPWECRMGWAVDLTKPEFQGKAALAASKDSTNLTLASLAFPADSQGLDGAEITVDGASVGTISMAIPSPALEGKMLALARIAKAQAVEGTVVSVAGTSGTVVRMPVYDPDRKRPRA
ncbi:aminomethyltransferase family protein [Pararhodobacter zhoushanensis]|uniref:Aminomethyltransferase family protein n=1 Tax=Pararhodobacter zhoushanensis TaxID=2479545 RepID=A0ABT3H2B6_9RHOB|nr:aminomethyltransferase family protein [Pararhodobacter zhoushanensis]MCW1933825.1 aminomethyltransferase family protein [Pararhodobacter zhoushanensis]